MLRSIPPVQLAPLVALLTLLEVAAGTAAVAWILDLTGRIGRGFRGSTAAICLVVVVLALGLMLLIGDPAVLVGARPGSSAGLVHMTIAFGGLLVLDLVFAGVGTDPARHVVGAVTAAAGLAAVSQGALVLGGQNALALLGVLPATLLLGSALGGMLVGHWYLIAPDLSFRPLRLAVIWIFIAVALQAVALIIALTTTSSRSLVLVSPFGALFWLLVVGSGVVFTGAVNGLTFHFARIRANQPATAMLYALIICVLMGMVPADLIFLQTAIPV